MKILSLNIRGFGGPTKIRLLQEMLGKLSVDFLSVQETGIVEDVERIVKLIWVHDEYRFCQVLAVGRSGGLLCIWRRSIFSASSALSGAGFLCVAGCWQGSNHIVNMINVYGPHEDLARKRLWAELLELHLTTGTRSCLMGDFNVVRKPGERKGSQFHQARSTAFNYFICSAGLTELQLGGRLFTWIGMGGKKLSKLDRIMISRDLLNEWPAISVVALERTFADHCPLLLKSVDKDYGPSPFRFFIIGCRRGVLMKW